MDAFNRALWALVGFLLLAAGVGALLVGEGAFGRAAADTALLPDSVVQWWQKYSAGGLLVVVIVGLVLAGVGWRLLRAQLRCSGRIAMGNLVFLVTDEERGNGKTVVHSPAVADRTEDDFERIPGVSRALVGLYGNPMRPELRAQLDVDARGALSRVLEGIDHTLTRFTTTTGSFPSSVDITFRLVDTRRRRVA